MCEVLEREYRRGEMYPSAPSLSGEPDSPLGTLIVTVLSQASNDEGTRKVYRAMRRRYPAWEDVARAPRADLVAVLRPGGLAEGKAANIQAILERIRRDFGDYSLEDMRSWGDTEVYDYLLDLPGVGPKTAGCVLLFSLERAAFPVDTHVARISRRLGLVPFKDTPEKIQRFLEPRVPPECALSLHLNLLEHGRNVCTARRARCEDCLLFAKCDRISIIASQDVGKRGGTVDKGR